MRTHNKFDRYFYIVGVVVLFLGALDPMEGSILIGVGSLLLAVTTYRQAGAQWKLFLTAFIMIAVGVIFLFYFSSRGGFGLHSTLSPWWGLLILPYPVGWALDVILLVGRIQKKPSAPVHG